jgi:pimeloyl-ACP methyl ester carboxylesterase
MYDDLVKPKPGSIALLEQVTLNGVAQWVLMRGEGQKKPVLLVLHGGLGTAEMLLFRKFLQALEKNFVVVNWGQLGAGKSYSVHIPPRLMNVEQFVANTIELTILLRQRFKQDKIYLMGHSRGSILGIKSIQRHPELFAAYIGVGQFVNFVEGECISYKYALNTAREKNITEAIRELEAIGPPPYEDDGTL